MRAIVFDFDGVIVDSEPMHEAALRRAAAALGLSFTHEQYIRRYVGFDDRDCFARIGEDNGRVLSDEDRARLAELKWTFAREAIERGDVRAFPGSLELVRAAAAAGPAALCSGARRHEIELIVSRLGIAGAFDVVVTADEVERSKPDPAPYLLTARRLGIDPGRCVAIEDSSRGIDSALAAGYRVVGVCHTLPAERLSHAHAVVASTAALDIGRLLRV